jgi:hypothetical protein
VRYKLERKHGPRGTDNALCYLQCSINGMVQSHILTTCMNLMNTGSSDISFIRGQCHNIRVLEGIDHF